MRKGFTLMELMMSIAIIGLLIVFLVPAVSFVMSRAREGSVKAVLHSVQLAVEAYNAENEAYPVASSISLRVLADNYLSDGGYMTNVPKNPFTGHAYEDKDISGKIIYNYDLTKDIYTLTGYKKDGITKILELSNI